ncbi:colicin transporter [Sphingobium sp. CR28]|uniref:colicin transporter n=1 Tax=Sphingobium sp. CR28 TaxID=3400272 RepID=UPI003FF09383
MIAIKRLASIMWILVVAMASLAAYLVSLRVATEHKAVNDLQREIYRTRASIRYLEAEFGTRASLVQLERWNAADLKLAVTAKDRFLSDETALASLDGIKPNGEAYVPPPVMTAMVVKPADAPAVAATRAASPAPSQVRTEFSLIRSAMANDNVAGAVKTAPAPAKVAASKPADVARTPSPVAKKVARMALLDDKLLDDASLRRLSRAASDTDDERRVKGPQ